MLTIFAPYLLGQVRLHFIITVPASAFLYAILMGVNKLVGDSSLVLSDLAGMMLLLPFLLLPWLFRRAIYVLQRPGLSAIGSSLYATLLIVLLIFIHRAGVISVWTAMLALSAVGFLASLLLFLLARFGSTLNRSLKSSTLIKENWTFGRWLLASSALVVLAGQAQIFIAGSMLDLASAGVVKALVNFAQPLILIVTALGSLLVPMLSLRFWARRHSLLAVESIQDYVCYVGIRADLRVVSCHTSAAT